MLKEIVVTIFYFAGPFAIRYEEVRPQLWVPTVSEAVGVPVRIKRVIKLRKFAPSLQKKDLWIKYSRRAFQAMKRREPNTITIGFLPPLLDDDGVRYMAGLGQVCDPIRGAAVINAQTIRSNGMDGVTPSLRIAQHELAHTLGALHDNIIYNGKVTLMQEQAGNFIQDEIGFSRLSKEQMRHCLSRY